MTLTCLDEKIGFYETMGFKNEGVSDSSHGRRGLEQYDPGILIKKGRIAGCVLFACSEKQQKYEMVSWLSFGANFFLRTMASTFLSQSIAP